MSAPELLRDDASAAGVTTLLELLDYRADAQPDDVVFRFVGSDGHEDGSLTFSALRRQARAVAARLAAHVAPGDRVLLLVPPSLEYVGAFFGCLYAGAVAVPAYPPNPRRADPRVTRIAADCGARAALVSAQLLARLDGWLALSPELSGLTWLDAALAPDDADGVTVPGAPATYAMLQYTSGSTGDPRGVMLTHANLIHNSAVIHRVSRHQPHDTGVFWLPPFHDMGLIGGILQPVYAGLSAALMAPASFLQRPLTWLEAMTRYRATTSGAPNFAYELCVERTTEEERRALDLSCWRTSYNGAEPIRADTIERFASAFAVSGLRPDVIMPCYGLAEATLIVSGGPPERPPVLFAADRRGLEAGELRAPDEQGSAVRLVGSGEPVAGQVVEIVDPDTDERCAERTIGEIWVSGPSVASGYWNRPEESATTFGARLPDMARPFLRTGDLGVLLDGQLVVTGRLKDLVILDGRNYYPHDIEVAAERSHPAIRAGAAAAFSAPSSRAERLVLVLEVSRHHRSEADDALFQAVRTEVAQTVGIAPDEIVLIRQNTIPKTSSGKIQRRACRAAFLGGGLEITGRWRTAEPTIVAPAERAITAFVLDWVRDELQVDPERLDPRTRLTELGLDSLAATRLLVALEGQLGRRIDAAQLWEQPNVGALARHLALLAGAAPHDARPRPVKERAAYTGSTAATTDVSQWPEYRALRARLDALPDAGIANPFFHVHEGVTGSRAVIGGRSLVNFANYNYLGLSGDPDVTRAAQEAAARFGTSVSASRVVSGERPIHRELEREIAGFLGVDDAIVYIGGHPANVSTISHVVGPEDVVLCDAFAHNSAVQGAELSGARRLTFPHNDWAALDKVLGRVRGQHRRALVVIEGVYSADGDIPDLERFVEVKRRHDALLMVDEAHSLGTLGATGRGIGEHSGVPARDVDLWMGTLSKSLASCGGYIAGSRALVEYLKYTSPGFVYSVGITPGDAGAALAALRKLQAEPERVARLQDRAARFLARCKAAGLDTGASAGTPVIPVIVGESLRAARLSELLFDAGINVQPMVAPSVPDDQARLRFFVACTHTDAELDDTVDAVVSALRRMGHPMRAAAPADMAVR